MKIAPLAEIKNKFSAYVEDSKSSPVIITKNGKPVAYLAAITDEDDLDSIFLAHDTRFRQLLDDAFQRYKEGKALTSDEFWERLRQKRARSTEPEGSRDKSRS